MPLPVIAVRNLSTVLPDAEVTRIIEALDRQVNLDFAAYWGTPCTLQFIAKTDALIEGWWELVVMDDPDQAGALGYHELAANGEPLGKVFAKLDQQTGSSPSVTMSHELLEMLADPWINKCVQGQDNKFYALEVSDAVEADVLGYSIDGVLLSDFVTPSYFAPTHADRFDLMKHLSEPLSLAPGGYLQVMDPGKGWRWTQVFSGSEKTQAAYPIGSRRHRRTIPRQSWRKSKPCSIEAKP